MISVQKIIGVVAGRTRVTLVEVPYVTVLETAQSRHVVLTTGWESRSTGTVAHVLGVPVRVSHDLESGQIRATFSDGRFTSCRRHSRVRCRRARCVVEAVLET